MQNPQTNWDEQSLVGKLDPEGELYHPPIDDEETSPGGGLEDGSTSGTTGHVLPPGAEEPVDDLI